MASSTKISARIQSDIVAQIDAYASGLEITRSEALERLISAGLTNIDRSEYLRNSLIQRMERLEKLIENDTNRVCAIQIKAHKKATLASLLGLNMIKVINNLNEDQVRALINAADAKAIEDLRNG